MQPEQAAGALRPPSPSHRSGSTAAGIGRKEDGDPGAGITPSHTIYWEALNQTLGHRWHSDHDVSFKKSNTKKQGCAEIAAVLSATVDGEVAVC